MQSVIPVQILIKAAFHFVLMPLGKSINGPTEFLSLRKATSLGEGKQNSHQLYST